MNTARSRSKSPRTGVRELSQTYERQTSSRALYNDNHDLAINILSQVMAFKPDRRFQIQRCPVLPPSGDTVCHRRRLPGFLPWNSGRWTETKVGIQRRPPHWQATQELKLQCNQLRRAAEPPFLVLDVRGFFRLRSDSQVRLERLPTAWEAGLGLLVADRGKNHYIFTLLPIDGRGHLEAVG